MAWIWEDDDPEEYEPDWRPVPDKPGWRYDANLGDWEAGNHVTGLPHARWRELYAA